MGSARVSSQSMVSLTDRRNKSFMFFARIRGRNFGESAFYVEAIVLEVTSAVRACSVQWIKG